MVADLPGAADSSIPVALVLLIDRIPLPDPPARRRGRPATYPDRLFLKALVIMLVRHLSKAGTLLAVLEEPTPEMRLLRALLTEHGRFPSRRTWERRLRTIPASLPGQIACLGRHLVVVLDPWARCGRAVAIDSTVLRASGGVWHKQHRTAGVVPHTSIDTEAHWTKSGRHGWVYGWKLHLVCTAAAVWIPLAAALTPANVADNEAAPALLRELPDAARYVLGDLHYNAPNVHDACARDDRTLITTRNRRGAAAGGVALRNTPRLRPAGTPPAPPRRGLRSLSTPPTGPAPPSPGRGVPDGGLGGRAVGALGRPRCALGAGRLSHPCR